MDENVISWNLANIISIILMFLIIWIAFGAVGHFVFRTGNKSAATLNVPQQNQVLGI